MSPVASLVFTRLSPSPPPGRDSTLTVISGFAAWNASPTAFAVACNRRSGVDGHRRIRRRLRRHHPGRASPHLPDHHRSIRSRHQPDRDRPTHGENSRRKDQHQTRPNQATTAHPQLDKAREIIRSVNPRSFRYGWWPGRSRRGFRSVPPKPQVPEELIRGTNRIEIIVKQCPIPSAGRHPHRENPKPGSCSQHHHTSK